MRKKLENQPSMKDVELIFKECLDELIELSTGKNRNLKSSFLLFIFWS